MNSFGDMAVVVPVFNPESGLLPLVDSFFRKGFRVVVVDDGSVEDVEAFERLPASVALLRHAVNKGKGRAIKTAIDHLAGRCPDVAGAVFVDGDGQHAPEDVVRVVEKMQETGNVVFGVRDFSSAGVPFRSRFGNVWTSLWVRMIFKIPIYDTQTGLRAVPRRLFAPMLEMEGERYEYEMRLFALLRSLGEKLEQVPIRTIYIAGNRASHFKPIRDSIRIYRGLFGDRFLKFCVSAFGSFCVDNGVFSALFFACSRFGVSREVAIALSFAGARLTSSLVNFFGNRQLVFGSNARVRDSLFRYVVLAVAVMALSCAGTTLLSSLWDVTGISVTWVKIAVDLLLFFLSYYAQKKWVFVCSCDTRSDNV